uniref:Putative site-specific DNA endonuclease n=1 Tax=Pleodorina starrii TaxID=330485 RepID=M9P804_9CHLO|nr:putative site-specific DNA endonuclease [Pleodorina starrii]AFY64416.1 putative site-specific DNA endonuclease [Pleodorina starrii]
MSKQNSAYNFSAYKQIKPAHKKPGTLEPQERVFLEWFIGFSEGDGSFFIKDNRCVFVINQADGLVLNKIRTFLGFGVLQSYKQNNRLFLRYIVQGEENIKRLIQLFNGNIHLVKVFNRFEKWVNHYNTYAQQPLTIKPRQNPQNIILDSAWIAGFYDAVGGFHASIGEQITKKGTKTLRLRLNAYVDQQYEKDVMEQIQKLFSITSLTVRNAEKKHFRVEAQTKKTIENILNYFDHYPLRGKKHILYAMWKKIALKYINSTQINDIENLRDRVKKIQEQNQKFKIEKNAFCFMTMNK